MKLTPLDIHHKEFRHSLRGYSEEEVDAFLDEVADEFERLFKESIDAKEKLEASQETLRQFQEQEQTIRNTMVSAQRSGEEIINKANEEAATVLRDAEVKAKEIIHNALTQKQQVQQELVRIKQAEEEFRVKFKGLLDQHAMALSEVKLPDDVNVLMGDTGEGVVGEVEIADVAAAPAPAPEPAW
jgi:cell division initiation protein